MTDERNAPPMLARSPKRAPQTAHNPSRWFGYYAGYSPAFVADTYLEPNRDAVLADPWNGSGTTTEVVQQCGFVGRGFDLNPAIVLVAKARLLRADIKPSHLSICDTILRGARRLADFDFLPEEPLAIWFAPSSAGTLRGLERPIQSVLIAQSIHTRLATASTLATVSNLAAFFYVALFRTVRHFLDPFTTSNPTWIKEPSSPRARLRPTADAIRSTFRAEVRMMFETAGPRSRRSRTSRTTVEIGDSTCIPLASASATAVVSSPPYCTRIDYAVGTQPELAVLAASRVDFQALRSSMLGTPLTTGPRPALDSKWGTTCTALLDKIKTHPSHASGTYYYNNHVLYFDRLFRSLAEIARILRAPGQCILVVQDSYYKGILNDLQTITTEMLAHFSLEPRLRHDHYLRATKAAVNTWSLKYRAESTATESVLAFAKC